MLKIFRTIFCLISILIETVIKSIAFLLFAVLYAIYILFYPILKHVQMPQFLEYFGQYAIRWKYNYKLTKIVYDAWS